jgi:hypothetical protein
MRVYSYLIASWLLLLGSFGALAASDPVEAALENVSVLARPGQVGYATASDGNAFVQCRRWGAGAMRCEAAGTLMQPSLKAVLTPARTSFLKAEGWSVDPAFGLFTQLFPPDLTVAQIAAKVRGALVGGYGAADSQIETRTTWVRDLPCPPRITYSQTLAGLVDNSPTMAAVTRVMCSYAPEKKTLASGQVETAAELEKTYGPRLRAELQRLRINAGRPGFVAVSAGIGYVQCAAEIAPLGLYCEAQSAESWAALQVVLTKPRIAWLHAAGFVDPGRVQNYSKVYRGDALDEQAIARELLELLFEVYGYRGEPALDFKTN